jgi:hypothetical protein
MRLDDFVLLGTTVPEPNTDGRVFVCSAGFSSECRRLVRIYPLARGAIPNRWHTYQVPLERNLKDNRDESWQVAADRRPGHHAQININLKEVAPAVPQHRRPTLLSRYVIGSIQEANAKRLSLAIIQPDDIELFFQANAELAADEQMTLFDHDSDQPAGARRFPWMPRLSFTDECGKHNLMLRDWGSFELQRKHDERYFLDNLATALHLSPTSSLLVGNMNNQRTTWLVISVLNGLREPESLFDMPAPAITIPAAAMLNVHKRDNWTCTRCGSAVDRLGVAVSEVNATASGPSVDDLTTVCARCLTGVEPP